MLTPHLVWRGKKGGRRIREANWNSWSPVKSHFSPHAVEFKFSETFFPPLKLGNSKQVFFRSAAPNLHSFAFWKCQPSPFHIKKKREKESCKNFNRRRRLEKKKFCLTAALEEKLFLWSSSKSLDYTLRIKKPWWFRRRRQPEKEIVNLPRTQSLYSQTTWEKKWAINKMRCGERSRQLRRAFYQAAGGPTDSQSSAVSRIEKCAPRIWYNIFSSILSQDV